MLCLFGSPEHPFKKVTDLPPGSQISDFLIGFALILLVKECKKESNFMGFLGNIARRLDALGFLLSGLDALLGPVVMLLYPLYATMRAIESPSPHDDQQWLTYWVLYSLLTLFELFCWKVLQWFPLWPYMKLVFCLWLVLPIFNGAAYIYENFVRRYVKIGGYVSSTDPEEQAKMLQMMNLDAKNLVVQYIGKHGPQAFARAIKADVQRTKKS